MTVISIVITSIFVLEDVEAKIELQRGSCFTDWMHLLTYDLRDKHITICIL